MVNSVQVIDADPSFPTNPDGEAGHDDADRLRVQDHGQSQTGGTDNKMANTKSADQTTRTNQFERKCEAQDGRDVAIAPMLFN